ncbi:MAG: protein kinase [Acidobacteriota bacterium]
MIKGEPAPATIGAFEVTRQLGMGGMGVVYEGIHRETGRRVALKTARVVDAGHLVGLRREIHALARLDHPGIVRIIAHGIQEGLPWYAMTLLEGPTLRHLVRSEAPPWTGASVASPTVPISANAATEVLPRSSTVPSNAGAACPLDLSITLVRRLCETLAYLHGEGVVHRDLKPDNVVVLPDDRPVIVDFGLMGMFAGAGSRETLLGAGDAAGTLHYVAPEQARGEPVDARADLYAVGCILYELLTGITPHGQKSPADLLTLPDDAGVEPPSRFTPDVPPDLDALVLRLLRRDPRRRIGYASVVASALSRFGARELDRSPAKTYLYRPLLSGRTGDVARIVKLLAAAQRGTGAAVAVGGESGIGKTRLAMEVAALGRASGMRVVVSECLPPTASRESSQAPLTPLLAAIADRCREAGPAAAERILGGRGRILARVEPAFASLPGAERFPPHEELPQEQETLAFKDALWAATAALANDDPILFVVDDVQWADAFASDVLGDLAGRARAAPIVILTTYRKEEVSKDASSLLSGMTPIPLGPLSRSEVAGVVADMLALDAPDEGLASAIASHSEGNPLFVAEYLRAAVAEGLVRLAGDGTWDLRGAAAQDVGALHLPQTLAALFARRFARLSPAARVLLEAAAVIGRRSSVELLTAMLGWDDDRALDSLDELVRSHVLEDDHGGASFAHDKLREAAYDAMSGERRADLHGRAATALDGLPAVARSPRLEEVAIHWERAGQRKLAAARHLEAARWTAGGHAKRRAISSYRSYLCLAREAGAERPSARIELLDLLSFLGPGEDFALESEGAVREARALGDDALLGAALRSMAKVHRRSRERELARRALEEAVACHSRTGNLTAEAAATADLAQCLGDLDDVANADLMFVRAVSMMKQLGPSRPLGETLLAFGGHLRLIERADEAHDAFEEALECFRATNDRRGEGMALGSLGNLEGDRGRLDEARPRLEAAHALFRLVGDRRGEAICLMNLGKCALDANQLQAAEEILERSRVLLVDLRDERLLRKLEEIVPRIGSASPSPPVDV